MQIALHTMHNADEMSMILATGRWWSYRKSEKLIKGLIRPKEEQPKNQKPDPVTRPFSIKRILLFCSDP